MIRIFMYFQTGVWQNQTAEVLLLLLNEPLRYAWILRVLQIMLFVKMNLKCAVTKKIFKGHVRTTAQMDINVQKRLFFYQMKIRNSLMFIHKSRLMYLLCVSWVIQEVQKSVYIVIMTPIKIHPFIHKIR